MYGFQVCCWLLEIDNGNSPISSPQQNVPSATETFISGSSWNRMHFKLYLVYIFSFKLRNIRSSPSVLVTNIIYFKSFPWMAVALSAAQFCVNFVNEFVSCPVVKMHQVYAMCCKKYYKHLVSSIKNIPSAILCRTTSCLHNR